VSHFVSPWSFKGRRRVNPRTIADVRLKVAFLLFSGDQSVRLHTEGVEKYPAGRFPICAFGELPPSAGMAITLPRATYAGDFGFDHIRQELVRIEPIFF
jgi:hypothetical protein